MSESRRERPLTVEIHDGLLSISIGVDMLCKSVDIGEQFVVTDVDGFSRDILYELNHDEEDGTTPLFILLDAAAEAAMESGSPYVDQVNK